MPDRPTAALMTYVKWAVLSYQLCQRTLEENERKRVCTASARCQLRRTTDIALESGIVLIREVNVHANTLKMPRGQKKEPITRRGEKRRRRTFETTTTHTRLQAQKMATSNASQLPHESSDRAESVFRVKQHEGWMMMVVVVVVVVMMMC